MRLRQSLPRYLFSVMGRLSRAEFWMCLLAALGVWFMAIFAVFLIADVVASRLIPAQAEAFTAWVDVYVMPPTGILMVWFLFALAARRFRDRGKRPWWALIILVPYVGWLWILVECGFLKGTPGDNKYGPDPAHLAGGDRNPVLRYLFSFKGRLSRLECWTCWAACIGLAVIPFVLGVAIGEDFQ